MRQVAITGLIWHWLWLVLLPFDRMLVAQAICESMTLLTADHVLADYSPLVEVI